MGVAGLMGEAGGMRFAKSGASANGLGRKERI